MTQRFKVYCSRVNYIHTFRSKNKTNPDIVSCLFNIIAVPYFKSISFYLFLNCHLTSTSSLKWERKRKKRWKRLNKNYPVLKTLYILKIVLSLWQWYYLGFIFFLFHFRTDNIHIRMFVQNIKTSELHFQFNTIFFLNAHLYVICAKFEYH